MYGIVDLQTWTTVHAVKELAAAHSSIISTFSPYSGRSTLAFLCFPASWFDIHFDAVKETIRIFFPDV